MVEMKKVENEAYNIDIHGKTFRRIPLIITILFGSLVAVLNQTLLSTALPKLMLHFDLVASQVQWVTTAFMLTNGVMIPMTALLLEKISTKKLYIFSMFVFAGGTILCAFSPSYPVLIAGRVFQAIACGILMPLVNTVFVLTFPAEKRGLAMGIYGLVISFGPALGPVIAGFFIDRFSWQFLFIGLLPFVAVDIILAFFLMRDIVPSKSVKIDIKSLVLSAVGFGGMLFGFSSAGSRGWSSPYVYLSILIGSATVVVFVIRQLSIYNPSLQLRVFKSPTFTLTTVANSFLNIAHVASTLLIPIFIQSVLGRSAFTSGMVLFPGAFIMAFVMLISGRLFDRYGIKRLVIPGIILVIISVIPFTSFSLDTSILELTIFNGFRFIGLGFIFMNLQAAGMNALPTELLHHATAVTNTSRQIVGSIGVAILVTIMSNIELRNIPGAALEQTNPAMYNEGLLNATISGMNVAFMCVLGIVLVGFVCILFVKETKKKAE